MSLERERGSKKYLDASKGIRNSHFERRGGIEGFCSRKFVSKPVDAKELRRSIDTLIFTSRGGDNLRVGDGNGRRGFP